jgi:hypothetical protein
LDAFQVCPLGTTWKFGSNPSLTFPALADKLCALEKSNLMKGGARPMIMNQLYKNPAFTGKADVDSRSAPVAR